jgi:hypothetical protein
MNPFHDAAYNMAAVSATVALRRRKRNLRRRNTPIAIGETVHPRTLFANYFSF